MQFLGAIFLWALPLAAVPVVIHLLNRRRRQVVPWGAMMFLRQAVSRRKRMWRWEDWLLMALRTLAVVAMVLALARPLVRSLWFGSAGGRDVILVLDTSMSTARVNSAANSASGSGSVFGGLVRRAEEILDQLGESDDVRVLLASTTVRWLSEEPMRASAENVARLKGQLRELKPTLASVDMPRCVLEAAQVEGTVGSRRVITVLSDQQAYGWRLGAGQAWQAVREALAESSPPAVLNVTAVNGGEADSVTNLSVESLTSNRTIVAPNGRLTLSAVVRNTGRWPTEPASVSWQSDGQSMGVTGLPALQPGGSADVSLACAFDTTGVHAVSCRVDRGDDLPPDSIEHVVIEVVERVPVLIIDGNGQKDPFTTETGYLLAALGMSGEGASEGGGGERSGYHSVFAPTVVSLAEAGDQSFDGFAAVVCADVGAMPDGWLQRLEAFVRRGGGVWWVLGENSDRAFFEEKVYAKGGGLSPLALDEPIGDADDHETFVLVSPPAPDHPATHLLADTQRLDMDRGRIYRRYRFKLDEAAAKVPVLLKTDPGDPVAVERRLDEGRVIVQAVPLNVGWSNLPLCQAFVVMVHEWLWYLAEPSFTRWNLEPGEALSVQFAADGPSGEASAVVTTPEEVTAPVEVAVHDDQVTCRFAETLVPGEYVLEMKGVKGLKGENGEANAKGAYPFHVRRDVRESDLTALTASDRQVLAMAADARFGRDPLADTAQGTRTPKVEPMWTWLLMAILVFMVAEMVLAGRMTRRRWSAAEPAAMGGARMSKPGAVSRGRRREEALAG